MDTNPTLSHERRPTEAEIRRVTVDACRRENRHEIREIMVPEDLFPVMLVCTRCRESRAVVRR